MRGQVQATGKQCGLQLDQSVATIAVGCEHLFEVGKVVTVDVRIGRVVLEECKPPSLGAELARVQRFDGVSMRVARGRGLGVSRSSAPAA
jgi:hypothetical protein